MFIDTHAHLDDEQFDGDRQEVIRRAAASGVAQTICIGTTAKSSQRCVTIAAEYSGVFAAVGIQPNYAHEAEDGDWEQITAMMGRPKVVAIGETGLDHYWDFAPLDLQEEFFIRHIQLSLESGLPFVVHMREPKSEGHSPTVCSEHILRVLQTVGRGHPLSGVMHSYTGNSEMAEEFVRLGLHISFAGMVTYKKSNDLREVASGIPLERLLVETDSPYLSPHPVRGKRRNEPAHIEHTIACLAEVLKMSPDETARITSKNARQLFDLGDESIAMGFSRG